MIGLENLSLPRYLFAVLVIILATAGRVGLDPLLGDLIPFPSLLIAVLVVAAYAGRGPALLAVVLGAACAARFLLPPRASFVVIGLENRVDLLSFVIEGVGIAMLGGALRESRREAECLAREADRRWQQLKITLDSIGDAVLVIDLAGRVTSLNPVAEKLTGWSSRAAIGQPISAIFQIIESETRRPVECSASLALSENRGVGRTNHSILIARDGQERHVEDNASPIRDESGQLQGAVLVFRDVSERSRAEVEKMRAGDEARTILENTTDAFCAFDRDWRFIYSNRKAEILLGRDRDALIGKNHWEEFPDSIGTRFEEAYRRALAEDVAVTLEEFYPAHQRWYEINAYPSAEGLSVYFRNVTEKKRAEEERARLLAASEQLRRTYETALSNSPDFNYIFDVEGRFQFANSALLSLWQKSLDEVVGKTFFELDYPYELAVLLTAQIREVIETTRSFRAETPYESRLGVRQYEYILVPVLGADGSVEAIVGSTRDITERKRTEVELQRNEARLRLFVEHTPAAVAMLDRELRYLLVSRRWLIDFNLGDVELKGQCHYDVMPEVSERWRKIYNRAIDGLVERAEEDLYVRPDGSEEWLCWEARPWHDAEGEVGGIIIFSQIISDQVRNRRVIQEQAETLSGILGASVDHISIMDHEGRYRFISNGGANVLGFEPREMEGKHWRELGISAEVMTKYMEQLHQVLRSKQPARQENFFETASGVNREFEYTIAPIVREDRQADTVVVISRDVTSQRLAERERLDLLKTLETRNAFMNAVQSQVPAAIVVADAKTGKILSSNHEARRILQHEDEPGRSLDDYRNTYMQQAFRPDGSCYGPGDWPLVRAQAGETVVGEEMELHLWDHSRVTIRVNAGPIKVGEEIVAAVVAYHDISDHKATERAARFLADASAILAGLIDYESTLQKVASLAVPNFADWAVVDMLEDDGSIKRVAVAHADPSKADLAFEIHRRFPADPSTVYGPAGVLRNGKSEFVHEFTDDRLVAGASNEEHVRLLRELGLRSYMCVPLQIRGETLGMLGFALAESGRRYVEHDLKIAEDLASRTSVAIENARLYGELKIADRRKNEFLATLAHELRNPLAPIRNALHLMRATAPDGDEIEADRAMAERQIIHLTRLIDDLMDVARISRGKIDLHTDVVDLSTIVNQAIETSKSQIEERHHHLSISFPEKPIRLKADPTRLEQILWNLLNNAAKYTEPGGRIDVVVELENFEVIIRVIDSGIGIRTEMLTRVFEMFTQVDDHKDHAGGGLGIGLSLVRALVEMHEGSIDARSDGPGQGSEFAIRLPILVDAPSEEKLTNAPISNRHSVLVNRRILVVDDNEDAARSLAKLFRRLHGQDARVAFDASSALDLAEAFRPELILLDIGLPGTDGYEVARSIRSRPWGLEVLIIALTGWGQEDDRRRSREAGFDHHLVKPVDPSILERLLAELELAPKAEIVATPGSEVE